jgi:glycerol-3-phosphate dehydrogenase
VKPVALSPQAREAALQAMNHQRSGIELDVLVVGGGVVGAGCALDAVTRGLTVGLVEGQDWASGTSSRSSKLIHGGLRYLEMMDFRLVAEALQERGLLLQRIAPHLVHPVKFLYPLKRRVWERAYVTAGVTLYDTMGLTSGTSRGVPHHTQLTKRHALREVPALRSDSLVGAVQYYDAQVDDARFVLALVRTAASYGAHCANRTMVESFLRQGERVTGAVLRDVDSGQTYEVHARQVVNATGVWTDDTQSMAGTRGQFHVRASKGVHLMVPRDRINSQSGLILRTEKSVLFVIPWGRHWLIGTTDTDWDLDKAHPAVSSQDVEYLLEHVNSVLSTPLSKEDVEGVYAGLRPLLSGDAAETSKLSREHLVGHPVPGLVVIAGGKFTTYRVMAKDTVDEVVRVMEGPTPGPSVTRDVALVGAGGYQALWNQRQAIADEYGVHVARVEHLLNRYGSMVRTVLDLIRRDRSLAEPLPGSDDYLSAEVVYAVTHEDARHLEDVLCRRTRARIESWDRGVAAAERTAELMGAQLGWDAERKAAEIDYYGKSVAAEREAETEPDDKTADAARLGASPAGSPPLAQRS